MTLILVLILDFMSLFSILPVSARLGLLIGVVTCYTSCLMTLSTSLLGFLLQLPIPHFIFCKSLAFQLLDRVGDKRVVSGDEGTALVRLVVFTV
jgi:hypothetical protein